ncbi:MAG TPA: tRNA glutamyl-Q(34) synthetase GluQRS [Aliidongia sp.]|uniref:tRNA glutamyl-Q(34) synthetase GluQRS n=1 Tax=Aliidongia sp. TaxID=1914230 RepID=UPI002DDCEE2E|nr:tRNA glutamyl-Q(34) synthetase GluQRS [Aliidongia sp.]HEV2675293.1 tRNA glutamyl-Q(34) synthetase GluQRS [Aliidongia sp.]
MPTTRFAPSPTGLLHIGHAASALFAHAQAAPDGRFLLRLEDIDRTRCRPEFAVAIEEDLAWLGLDWIRPVRVQSAHVADYAAVLEGLRARGLVYPCFCTRSAAQAEAAGAVAAPHGLGPIYPGTCRHLSAAERADRIAAGIPHALRLDVAKAQAQTGPLTWRDLDRGTIAATPERLGDVVLARKDCPTSYHLSVTWDDALQGVDLVTRGEDLVEATHIHRLLQALLDLPVPAWRHHPLLLDAQGKRFAKRDKAPTLHAMRESGKSAAEIRASVGY